MNRDIRHLTFKHTFFFFIQKSLVNYEYDVSGDRENENFLTHTTIIVILL
jgi:hypothetical protein